MEAADQLLTLGVKAAGVVGFLVSLALILLASRFATKAELAAVSLTASDTKTKVLVMEKALESLPNKESMHELALAIERLRGDFKGVAAQIDGMGGTLKRIDTTLDRHEDIIASAARET